MRWYDVAIVGRETDVCLVTKHFYDLEVRRKNFLDSSFQPPVCFAPYFYGSGKTVFVKTFLDLAKNLDEDILGKHIVSDMSTGPFSAVSKKSFLSKTKEAKLLYVSLSDLKPMLPEERSFKWALYYLLLKTAFLEMGLPEPEPLALFQELNLRTEVFVEKIRSVLGISPDRYLLFSFDEVGFLKLLVDTFSLQDTSHYQLAIYHDFFRIIRELCVQPCLFLMVAGRCQGISIKYYVSSIVELRLIPLSPLEQNSIKEHLEKSSLNTVSISCILCSKRFLKVQFASLLFEYTGGVPGILVHLIGELLECALKNPHFLLTNKKFLSIVSRRDIAIRCVFPGVKRLRNLNERRESLMATLIACALFHIRFETCESNREHTDSAATPMLDVVTDIIGLYHRFPTGCRDNCFEVLIPKLLVSCIGEVCKGKSFIQRIDDKNRLIGEDLRTKVAIKLFLRTLHSQPLDFFFRSESQYWEGLVAMQLFLHFSRLGMKSSLVSTLAQLSSVWREMDLEYSFNSPAFYSKMIDFSERSSKKPNPRKGWRRFIENTLEWNKIYLPFRRLYKGPDILFKLRGKTGKQYLLVGVICSRKWWRENMPWGLVYFACRHFLEPVRKQLLEKHRKWHCMLILLCPNMCLFPSAHDTCCFSRGDTTPSHYVVPEKCELITLCPQDVYKFLCRDVWVNARLDMNMSMWSTCDYHFVETIEEMISSLDIGLDYFSE